jgi:hypothetical protein
MARDSKAIHIRYISKEKGFVCRDIFTDTTNIDDDNYKLSIGKLTNFEEQTIFIKQINVSINSVPGYGNIQMNFYNGNRGNNALHSINSHSLDGISVELEKFLNAYLKKNVDKFDDWDIDKKVSRLEKENNELKRRLEKINEILNSDNLDSD